MATLTRSEITRSTVIVPASRPRLSMPVSPALEMIMDAERPYAVSGQFIEGPVADLRQGTRADLLINDKFTTTTTTIDIAGRLGSRKPCGGAGDQGAQAMKHDATGAFVTTSLGSRPLSPPV